MADDTKSNIRSIDDARRRKREKAWAELNQSPIPADQWRPMSAEELESKRLKYEKERKEANKKVVRDYKLKP